MNDPSHLTELTACEPQAAHAHSGCHLAGLDLPEPIGALELLSLPGAEALKELREEHWPEGNPDLFLAALIHGALGRNDWSELEDEIGVPVPQSLRDIAADRCVYYGGHAALGVGVLWVSCPDPLHIPCLLDLEHDRGGLFGCPARSLPAAVEAAADLAAWLSQWG